MIRRIATLLAFALISACGSPADQPASVMETHRHFLIESLKGLDAAESGVFLASAGDLGVESADLTASRTPARLAAIADGLLERRGLFLAGSPYRLIAKPRPAQAGVREIPAPAGQVFSLQVSPDGQAVMAQGYDREKHVSLWRDGRWIRRKYVGDFRGGGFTEDGAYMFVREWRGTSNLEVLGGDDADVAPPIPTSGLVCHSQNPSAFLILVAQGGRILKLGAQGAATPIGKLPASPVQCLVAWQGADARLWAVEPPEGAQPGRVHELAYSSGSGAMTAHSVENLPRGAEAIAVNRGGDVVAAIKTSWSDGSAMAPLYWVQGKAGFTPTLFHFEPIGRLTSGFAAAQPLDRGRILFVAQDGVLVVASAATCLLSDKGIGIGGAWNASGGFVATHDPAARSIDVADLALCSPGKPG